MEITGTRINTFAWLNYQQYPDLLDGDSSELKRKTCKGSVDIVLDIGTSSKKKLHIFHLQKGSQNTINAILMQIRGGVFSS